MQMEIYYNLNPHFMEMNNVKYRCFSQILMYIICLRIGINMEVVDQRLKVL
ncbi:hypothetical protein D3C85_989460 [compost metagenome]